MSLEDVCSSYSFHQAPLWYSWEVARESCRSTHYSDLVSMESNDEWEYLRNITKTKKGSCRSPWYIGLKYSSPKWCWLSNTSACINNTLSSNGKGRLFKHEPNYLGAEHCVEMFFNGRYNKIGCSHSFRERGRFNGGYISERKVGKKQHSLHEYVCLYYVCPNSCNLLNYQFVRARSFVCMFIYSVIFLFFLFFFVFFFLSFSFFFRSFFLSFFLSFLLNSHSFSFFLSFFLFSLFFLFFRPFSFLSFFLSFHFFLSFFLSLKVTAKPQETTFLKYRRPPCSHLQLN